MKHLRARILSGQANFQGHHRINIDERLSTGGCCNLLNHNQFLFAFVFFNIAIHSKIESKNSFNN